MASDQTPSAAIQEAASEAFSHLTDVAKSLSDETALRYRQGQALVRDHVAASIGASVGVGVAVGLVAGMLLARR